MLCDAIFGAADGLLVDCSRTSTYVHVAWLAFLRRGIHSFSGTGIGIACEDALTLGILIRNRAI